MEKTNVGLISCGNMGMSLAKGLNELGHARIAGVCDVDEEKASALGKELDVPYELDYKEFVERDELQGIIVASPPFLHREMTIAAAKAGKHVFCEKPMATNLADCDAMIEACRESNVKLTIGQVCRFHAVHSRVKEIVDSGELGAPICMIVRRIGGGWERGTWSRTWRFKRELSGGILMEINAHEIDFMRYVCGDVKRVYAVGDIYTQHQADYPDEVLISLNFANGVIGSLHASQSSVIGAYGGRVDCEKGSLHFPNIWGEDAGITVGRLGEDAHFIPLSDIKVETPVTHELRRFVDAVIKDEPPAVPGDEGRAAVEVAVAAYKSIETGTPVELPLRG